MSAVRAVDVSGLDPASFTAEVMAAGQPIILRGAVADWPLTGAARSADALIDYLGARDAGLEAEMFVGPPTIAGRYHYGAGSDGFNFTREPTRFGTALERILATVDQADAPSLYVGSLPAERYLPGLAAANALSFVPPTVAPRIWFGHRSSVACHYDTLDNVACVIAGRRRFTLYPPDAIGDLYVGPIDHTMAGQPVSLADDSTPADPRYPRFAAVAARAQMVELEAGDALYLPKLWWHRVEATAPFNMLVNYWWDGFASGPDQPYTTMLLAMAAIAERPPAERAAWRAWFDHYVFRPDGHPLAHLPEDRHGILGPLRPDNYGRIRALVMRLMRNPR